MKKLYSSARLNKIQQDCFLSSAHKETLLLVSKIGLEETRSGKIRKLLPQSFLQLLNNIHKQDWERLKNYYQNQQVFKCENPVFISFYLLFSSLGPAPPPLYNGE